MAATDAGRRARSPTRTDGDRVNAQDSLSVSTSSTSAGAAVSRSLLLFLGLMFRRPSKLFRPNRVDTWGALRHLAVSADQSLSPSFIRTILKAKGGVLALAAAVFPPLLINTTLGFLLFTSHSLFSLCLARLPLFQRRALEHDSLRVVISDNYIVDFDFDIRDPLGVLDGDYGDRVAGTGLDDEEEDINFETLLRGPSIIPRHPTLLSAIAGAGAGVEQGLAFTPVENLVRLLQGSASSLTVMAARLLHLPLPDMPASLGPQPASPVEAIRTFLASDTWRRSRSWWTGWRWAIGRDALSYGVFFAAFDVTRRMGLRVRALLGGPISTEWHNILSVDKLPPIDAADAHHSTLRRRVDDPGSVGDRGNDKSQTPTRARVAQAATIVAGGVTASLLAEIVGRPFRACQKIMQQAHADVESPTESSGPASKTRTKPPGPASARSSGARAPRARVTWEPILRVYRSEGLRPFVQPDRPPTPSVPPQGSRLMRMATRAGWRLAAVGPWGVGFLVWAGVGGEI